MKNIYNLLLLIIVNTGCAQNKEMDSTAIAKVAMTDTYQRKDSQSNYLYYENGSSKPFTGILYGKYENGNYLSVQEYKDGLGNGYWIDYDPEGNIECKGTYKNNKVEGPVTFYYENGSIKSQGQFMHLKKRIGEWIYYDKKGNVVLRLNYTM